MSGGVNVSGSMIRKITRGTSSGNGEITISCNITDTNKVIVLLDADYGIASLTNNNGDQGAAAGSAYLKSISNSNIIVTAQGVTQIYSKGTNKFSAGPVTFSYQIIEFM